MKEAKDTFLTYLNTNLSTLIPPITVHPMRKDPNNPSSNALQIDALNVGFGKIDFGVTTTTLYVKLDIVCNSEISAGYITQQVWLLLSNTFYTPLYDYTIPASPVATGTMLMWKRDRVKFSTVQDEKDDKFFRYSCTLPVEFHNATT